MRGQRNVRITRARGQLTVGGVAPDLSEVGRGQVVGVAKHRVGHGAESRCQAEVFGPLTAEREDEFGGVLADVLDVMQ